MKIKHVQSHQSLDSAAITEASTVKAPRQLPIEPIQTVPQFWLEKQENVQENFSGLQWGKQTTLVIRRHSLDLQYSILGFLDRKIKEKSRTRVHSQEIFGRENR